MRFALFAIGAAALLPKIHVLGSEFGYSQKNGQEKLLGSSFGFPGTSKTFDYVVSLPAPIQNCFPSVHGEHFEPATDTACR